MPAISTQIGTVGKYTYFASQAPVDAPTEVHTNFKHPGYPEPYNCFLTLLQTDQRVLEPSGETFFGLHHNTARVACEILTGNVSRNGFFAFDRNGHFAVDANPEDVLTEAEYYYIVPEYRSLLHSTLLSTLLSPACMALDDNKCMSLAVYAIVASFQDWIFPHEDLDSIWPEEPVRRVNRTMQVCNITGTSPCERALLVPIDEEPWYRANRMELTIGPPYPQQGNNPMRDDANAIHLRPDMIVPFRSAAFAVVPKLTPSGMQYVMTALLNRPLGDWSLFNGRVAHRFQNGSKHHLFARFAWAIFQHANPFIGPGFWRVVLRRVQDPATGLWLYRREFIHLTTPGDRGLIPN